MNSFPAQAGAKQEIRQDCLWLCLANLSLTTVLTPLLQALA